MGNCKARVRGMDRWFALLLRSYGETAFATQEARACLDEARLIGERSLVRKRGFEPPRSCDRQPLKLVRLPFRHFRITED